MSVEKLLNFLINANVLVLTAALAFLLVEACITFFGYRKSYSMRLWLLTGSLASAAILTVVFHIALISNLRISPNLSDMLVAQYLKGNLSVSAVNFDTFLGFRTTALHAVQTGSNGWITAGVSVLVIAFAARIGYILVNVIRIHKTIRAGHCVRRTKYVDLIVASGINVPFSTRNHRKHFVVVPETLLKDGQTLAVAIGHEFQHIRQRDVTVEFLLVLCSPFFVLNPGFWFLSQRLRILREFTCDIEFLHRSHFSARDYAKALLTVAKLVSQSRRFSRIGSLSVPLVGRSQLFAKSTKSNLAQRVLVLADNDLPSPNKYLAASLLVVASAFILFGTSTFQPAPGWSHDRIMISSVANLERLSHRNSVIETANLQVMGGE